MSRLSKIFMTLAMLAVFGLAAPIASADDFAEVGDAPETLPGQSATGGTNPLTGITGTISSSTDADLFRIFISSPATFTATTVGTGGTLVDTQLFLFSSSGLGIIGNDDSVGLRSTIGPGIPGLVAPGEYLIAISGFNRDPISAGGFIFGPGIGTVFPTGPGGGQPLTGFSGTGGAGTYRIQLTGAQFVGGAVIPEPATMILLGTGLAGIAAKVRRRRKVSND